jgi:hypothetical protein
MLPTTMTGTGARQGVLRPVIYARRRRRAASRNIQARGLNAFTQAASGFLLGGDLLFFE